MSTQRLLAAISMTSGADKTQNLEQAEILVREAAKCGADWVMLPELFTFIGPYDQLHAQAEQQGGPVFQRCSTWAAELNIILFAGSMGERAERTDAPRGYQRVYNTSYVFGRSGQLLGKYRKTHLFNLRDEKQTPIYCESDGFLAGDQAVVIEVDGYRVGLSICYDLRFGGLYNRFGQNQAFDVIAIPSAFTQQTGMDHWEVLLRARAIEHQAYVFASNQTGTHAPQKISYGHSMIIDPWGHKLADSGNASGLALALISKERIAAVRAQLPALVNRRPELYG